MYKILKTSLRGELIELKTPEPGCWISVIHPDVHEITWLKNEIGILPEFLQAALDPEETSHIDIDQEENQTLIIADYCLKNTSSSQGILSCTTHPLGLIFQETRIITLSIEPNPFIEQLEQGKIRSLNTQRKTEFFLHLMFSISQKYQLYLRQIEAESERISDRLYKNISNKGISEMMELDKSLIYFSASLNADENILQKIRNGRILPIDEEDHDLLDDVLIEYQQSLDMCTIYTSINERVSNGCNSILSNNMNDIMKKLTVITIVMSIPNMIYGFYGMNVGDLPLPYAWFPFTFSIICCIICWIYFQISGRYK